ncbi:hypothetical protein AG1IA_00320 [Rhizoctonia solani AG-1 IA]|uniref:Uncharacterized protein n=1 Tax=Thanatephorus cucumeris (strain AG1-IA) TaxID=983506 RepID=L8X983_THACA|nr:hypothetical protein AG1IA_00320 [Rhizoctonia solani AG-1 IA]
MASVLDSRSPFLPTACPFLSLSLSSTRRPCRISITALDPQHLPISSLMDTICHICVTSPHPRSYSTHPKGSDWSARWEGRKERAVMTICADRGDAVIGKLGLDRIRNAFFQSKPYGCRYFIRRAGCMRRVRYGFSFGLVAGCKDTYVTWGVLFGFIRTCFSSAGRFLAHSVPRIISVSLICACSSARLMFIVLDLMVF